MRSDKIRQHLLRVGGELQRLRVRDEPAGAMFASQSVLWAPAIIWLSQRSGARER